MLVSILHRVSGDGLAFVGLQVLIEDYVHVPGNRFAALLVVNLAAFAGAAFGLLCLIRIGLGSA